ncbi:hypothetical protein JCM10207_003093 [Rhodosporidiobolus poonsookiae]
MDADEDYASDSSGLSTHSAFARRCGLSSSPPPTSLKKRGTPRPPASPIKDDALPCHTRSCGPPRPASPPAQATQTPVTPESIPRSEWKTKRSQRSEEQSSIAAIASKTGKASLKKRKAKKEATTYQPPASKRAKTVEASVRTTRASAPADHTFQSIPTIYAISSSKKREETPVAVEKSKKKGRRQRQLTAAETKASTSPPTAPGPPKELPARQRSLPKRYCHEQDPPNAERPKKKKKEKRESTAGPPPPAGEESAATASSTPPRSDDATPQPSTSSHPLPSSSKRPKTRSSPQLPSSEPSTSSTKPISSSPKLPGLLSNVPLAPKPSLASEPPFAPSTRTFAPLLPASLPTLPSIASYLSEFGVPFPAPQANKPARLRSACPSAQPVKVSTALKAPKGAKATKPSKDAERKLHPALLSRDSWVECAKNLTLTAAGRPPIWAESRQELCESLEYYKAYQGGHYDLQERCLGYLLDGFASSNDRCADQGRVIISHGGGCSELAPSSAASTPVSRNPSTSSSLSPSDPLYTRAAYRLRTSQTRDNLRMRALRNCLEKKVPVVLIAGSMWEAFPRLGELGQDEHDDEDGEGKVHGRCRYAVLGHYLVTDIWAEGEPVGAGGSPGSAGGKKDVKGKGKAVESPVPESDDPDYHVRFKVRFEWVAAQGRPWFADVIGGNDVPASISPSHAELATDALAAACSSPSTSSSAPSSLFDLPLDPGSPMTDSTSLFGDDGTVTCSVCEETHKRIYVEPVECYNEKCERFFLLDGVMPLPASLTYLPSLVSPSIFSSNETRVPESLIPRTLQSLVGSPSISDYSWQSWRGFGCDRCGRVSSRADWNVLRCTGCGAETSAKGRVLKAVQLKRGQLTKKKEMKSSLLPSDEFSPLAPSSSSTTKTRPSQSQSAAEQRQLLIDPSFAKKRLFSDYLEGYSIELGPGATVYHLWPRTMAGLREADRLFEEYQGDEAGKLFVRNKLSVHKTAGSLLCQQFTFNAGEHYKHTIRAQTYPFPPDPASSASASASKPLSPYETDDKASHAPQCAKEARDLLKGVVQLVVGEQPTTDFNEILSVAYMTGGKMNYHDDGERGLGPYVASISLGADATMSFRPKVKKGKPGKKKKVVSEPNAEVDEPDGASGEGNSRKARACLKMRLMHGDIMIMEGEAMQKLFEHMVEPEPGVRFAATARFVGPDHLIPAPAPKHRTTTYSSGFEGSAPAPPSRFSYQDDPAYQHQQVPASAPAPSTQRQPPTVQRHHVYSVPQATASGKPQGSTSSLPPAFPTFPLSSLPPLPPHAPAQRLPALPQQPSQAEFLPPLAPKAPPQTQPLSPRPSQPGLPLLQPAPAPVASQPASQLSRSSGPGSARRPVPPPPPPYVPGCNYDALRNAYLARGGYMPVGATPVIPFDPTATYRSPSMPVAHSNGHQAMAQQMPVRQQPQLLPSSGLVGLFRSLGGWS